MALVLVIWAAYRVVQRVADQSIVRHPDPRLNPPPLALRPYTATRARTRDSVFPSRRTHLLTLQNSSRLHSNVYVDSESLRRLLETTAVSLYELREFHDYQLIQQLCTRFGTQKYESVRLTCRRPRLVQFLLRNDADPLLLGQLLACACTDPSDDAHRTLKVLLQDGRVDPCLSNVDLGIVAVVGPKEQRPLNGPTSLALAIEYSNVEAIETLLRDGRCFASLSFLRRAVDRRDSAVFKVLASHVPLSETTKWQSMERIEYTAFFESCIDDWDSACYILWNQWFSDGLRAAAFERAHRRDPLEAVELLCPLMSPGVIEALMEGDKQGSCGMTNCLSTLLEWTCWVDHENVHMLTYRLLRETGVSLACTGNRRTWVGVIGEKLGHVLDEYSSDPYALPVGLCLAALRGKAEVLQVFWHEWSRRPRSRTQLSGVSSLLIQCALMKSAHAEEMPVCAAKVDWKYSTLMILVHALLAIATTVHGPKGGQRAC